MPVDFYLFGKGDQVVAIIQLANKNNNFAARPQTRPRSRSLSRHYFYFFSHGKIYSYVYNHRPQRQKDPQRDNDGPSFQKITSLSSAANRNVIITQKGCVNSRATYRRSNRNSFTVILFVFLLDFRDRECKVKKD
jgi:hypothetical protein